MTSKRLSLTREEAGALFDASFDGVLTAALRRAQSKLARRFGFVDPHPPRASPHRKTRQQSPELREKRAVMAKLVGARRIVRRIGPAAEAVIADRLRQGLPPDIALAACQEIITNAAGLEEKIKYQASKGTPLGGMKLVYEQAAHAPSARRAIDIIERLEREADAQALVVAAEALS